MRCAGSGWRWVLGAAVVEVMVAVTQAWAPCGHFATLGGVLDCVIAHGHRAAHRQPCTDRGPEACAHPCCDPHQSHEAASAGQGALRHWSPSDHRPAAPAPDAPIAVGCDSCCGCGCDRGVRTAGAEDLATAGSDECLESVWWWCSGLGLRGLDWWQRRQACQQLPPHAAHAPAPAPAPVLPPPPPHPHHHPRGGLRHHHRHLVPAVHPWSVACFLVVAHGTHTHR